MVNVKIGSIPDSVTYIHTGNAREVSTSWLSVDVPISPGVMVIDAFASPTDSEKTIESGMMWIKQRTKTPVVDTKKNDAITGIKVISLERRGEGGRAYKVITPDGFYFDLREDVLLDTMLYEGVEKGGVLNGSFIWGYIGSQMKLVRVGSALHSALEVANKRDKKQKISRKDLEIGGIYKAKANIIKVFLGNVDTVELRDCYGKKGVYKRKNYMLWYETQYINDVSKIEKLVTDLFMGRDSNTWHHISVTKQHSFIEKLGQININVDILKTLKEYTLESAYYNNNLHNENYRCAMAHILNAQKAGTGYMMHEEYAVRYGYTL